MSPRSSPDPVPDAGPSSGPDEESELLRLRDRFPILERTTYLISNSLGAMPRKVERSLEAYARTWSNRGVRAWGEGWWELPVEVGDRIAPLIGVSPGTVSTHLNVTLASAVAASCLDFGGDRDGIVCSELNFPSLIYLFRRMERRGARLRLVPSPDGRTVPLEDLLDAIDETTRLVAVSHVVFKSAYLQDAEAIVRRAHDVGARVLLDVYQSAGCMPLELERLQVDFAVGGTLKWLCGGPGVSYLYVRPDVGEEVRPGLTGWMAHREPFAFDAGPLRPRSGAWGFLNGTPNVPGLHAAMPGLEILGGVDLAAVRRKSVRQTDRLIAAADERGWQVNTPRDPSRRGGTVSLGVPRAEEVTEGLLERDVLVDHRPGVGIRLSPHFYTKDEEIDRAVAAVAELV